MLLKSFQVYFIALACSDSVAMLSWGVQHIFIRGPGINMRKIRVLTHVQEFLMNSSMSISAWYITYIAVERAFIVLLPLKAKQISTPKNAKRAVLTITVTIVMMMSPVLWMPDWLSTKNKYLEAFQGFYTIKKTYFRIIYSYLPVLVTCLFYLLLFIKIVVTKLQHTHKHNQSKLKIGTFSKSILVVFITYFVLTIPSTVVILSTNVYPGWKTNLLFVTIVQEFVLFLRLLNYSSNFVIYWFTNLLFQKETLKLLCRKTQVNPIGSYSRNTDETRA